MRVTVKDKNLNVRIGQPSVNAPCNQFLVPGTVIEVDDELHKGDMFHGIDTWMKDSADNFYWSGGVSGGADLAGIDYKSILKNINPDIINNQGQDITIVIIDGGVNFNNTFFDIGKTQSINIESNPISSDHGNFIAGIIGGIKTVAGVTPKANIVSLKYKSDNTGVKDLLQNLIKALNFVLNVNGSVVVNLSQGFSDFVLDDNADEKNQIIALVKQITNQKNKFIVCSGGDNALLSDNVLFPANQDECIAVGSLNEFHKDVAISKQLQILTPIVNFTSFDLNFGLKKDIGSSYATAVISSLIGCIISSNDRNNITLKNADVIKELQKFSVEKTLFQFDEMKSFQFQIV